MIDTPKVSGEAGVLSVGRTVLFLITLIVAAAAVGLGIWQLRRHEQRKAANEEARLVRAMPPMVIPGDGRLAPNRRAQVTGRYDESREFLLRGRVVQGVPAVQVVTPLRIPGVDTAILVNRGYVPAPDAAEPGSAQWPEAGTVEVTGMLVPVPNRGDGAPITRGGRETWKSLDLGAMRARLPYPIAPVYLIAQPPDTGVAHTIRGRVYPFRAEPPSLDAGPHLMYAIQWFGIAVAALAFGIVFVLRETSGRRIGV
ncbi:MAG: SURF1 family protein [Gemmatimonadales bacterium]